MRASISLIAFSLVAPGLSLLVVPATVIAADEPAATAKAKAKDDPNRLICRRMEESGSLARSRRVCYTRADWERLAERSRRDSMAGSMTGGTSGN